MHPGVGGGGGAPIKKGRRLLVAKAVLVLLRVFSLKGSNAGDFVASFRILNPKNRTENNVLI